MAKTSKKKTETAADTISGLKAENALLQTEIDELIATADLLREGRDEAGTEENEENMKVVLALKEAFEVDTRDALWLAASKLKADLDGGILKHDLPPAKKELTASEAIYAFCAWLTTCDARTVMSAKDDAAPIAESIKHFCCVNNLAEPRDEYTELFIMPQDTPPQAVDPAAEIDVLYITTDYGRKYTCRTLEMLGFFIVNFKKERPNVGFSISHGRMTEVEYSKIPLDKYLVKTVPKEKTVVKQ